MGWFWVGGDNQGGEVEDHDPDYERAIRRELGHQALGRGWSERMLGPDEEDDSGFFGSIFGGLFK